MENFIHKSGEKRGMKPHVSATRISPLRVSPPLSRLGLAPPPPRARFPVSSFKAPHFYPTLQLGRGLHTHWALSERRVLESHFPHVETEAQRSEVLVHRDRGGLWGWQEAVGSPRPSGTPPSLRPRARPMGGVELSTPAPHQPSSLREAGLQPAGL